MQHETLTRFVFFDSRSFSELFFGLGSSNRGAAVPRYPSISFRIGDPPPCVWQVYGLLIRGFFR